MRLVFSSLMSGMNWLLVLEKLKDAAFEKGEIGLGEAMRIVGFDYHPNAVLGLMAAAAKVWREELSYDEGRLKVKKRRVVKVNG